LERRPVRILLVEDFAPLRPVIVSLVGERRDLQVVGEAEEGLAAISQARELKPELILMDIRLPKLGGVEAARRIRELVPSVTIVFLTQETSPEYVNEALATGALGYVHKSRIQSDLLPAIDKALTGQRFVSENLRFDESAEVGPRGRHEILLCRQRKRAEPEST
jgi:two-component system invasion response regulator UvrY